MILLTFNSHTYQHLGDIFFRQHLAYWTSLTIWFQSLEPTMEGGNCAGLHSNLTRPSLSFLSVHFFLSGTVPLSPNCLQAFFPADCSYRLYDTSNLKHFILYDFILTSPFRNLIHFSNSPFLITSSHKICCQAYWYVTEACLGHTGQRDLSYAELEFLIWMLYIT